MSGSHHQLQLSTSTCGHVMIQSTFDHATIQPTSNSLLTLDEVELLELDLDLDVDLRSRDAPGTLELDVDCDVSVTTTTLLRDSTLDSVTSPCCCPQPPALLDDLQLEPSPARLDPVSTRVHVVSTAADMEDWNHTVELLSDDTTSSRNVVAHDVIPEPEVYANRK